MALHPNFNKFFLKFKITNFKNFVQNFKAFHTTMDAKKSQNTSHTQKTAKPLLHSIDTHWIIFQNFFFRLRPEKLLLLGLSFAHNSIWITKSPFLSHSLCEAVFDQPASAQIFGRERTKFFPGSARAEFLTQKAVWIWMFWALLTSLRVTPICWRVCGKICSRKGVGKNARRELFGGWALRFENPVLNYRWRFWRIFEQLCSNVLKIFKLFYKLRRAFW